MQEINGKKFLDEKELARYLGVSLSWVRKCRYSGEGVRYKKFGRCVRYDVTDIFDYASSKNQEVL